MSMTKQVARQLPALRPIHQLPTQFAQFQTKHPAIHLIMSPPRCSSTALARVFWEHPSIGYYNHEPFEETYYRDASLESAAENLAQPLDLSQLNNEKQGESLVVKEMPYQAGQNFPLLAALATEPILFLIRDPRLNISSRIEKKLEGGDGPQFPWIETGWELLCQQIEHCEQEGIPYLLVDASDFRNHPMEIFPQIFERLGLLFKPDMLSWEAYPEVDLDNLGGDHSHLYRRVLLSTGIQPATEPIPALDTFPTENGCREHVKKCLDIYAALSESSMRVKPMMQTAIYA